jgi:polysaccharide biosynthesis protein PslJ
MLIDSSNALQEYVARLDRRLYAILIGLTIGVIGGLIGLALATVGPIITFGAVLGLLAGLYILTDVSSALYGFIITMMLLPFGTLPFKIGLTPTLLDITIGVFILVYLLQWMTGRRHMLQLTPVHALLIIYILWFILSFALGLRYAPPTPNKLRQFAETLMAISMVFILTDLMRDPKMLRRLVLIVIAMAGIQALIAIVLYALPDAVAERTLIRLARIGYPDGGVIRYINDYNQLPERAIGTWVDPNVLGGALAIFGAMIAPQLFARKPVLRYRWLTFLVIGLVFLALILTFSRAAMLGLGIGLTFIAFIRYRKFIPLLALAVLLLLLLPQTQGYIERFIDAFTISDKATQMRVGEYGDSLKLISRYPIFGVGFTGRPEIDLYTDVASMYLIIANQMGLVGLALFLMVMAAVFVYGWRAWRYARDNPELDSIVLGYHASLLTVLMNSVVDMYFFRLDFQAPITLFWLTVALSLASARLSVSIGESTVVKRVGVS